MSAFLILKNRNFSVLSSFCFQRSKIIPKLRMSDPMHVVEPSSSCALESGLMIAGTKATSNKNRQIADKHLVFSPGCTARAPASTSDALRSNAVMGSSGLDGVGRYLKVMKTISRCSILHWYSASNGFGPLNAVSNSTVGDSELFNGASESADAASESVDDASNCVDDGSDVSAGKSGVVAMCASVVKCWVSFFLCVRLITKKIVFCFIKVEK